MFVTASHINAAVGRKVIAMHGPKGSSVASQSYKHRVLHRRKYNPFYGSVKVGQCTNASPIVFLSPSTNRSVVWACQSYGTVQWKLNHIHRSGMAGELPNVRSRDKFSHLRAYLVKTSGFITWGRREKFPIFGESAEKDGIGMELWKSNCVTKEKDWRLRERIQDDRRWFIVRAENLVEELEEEAKHSGSIEEERINSFFSTTTQFIYIHRCKSPLVSTRCFCAGELPKHIELTRRQTGMETALIKGKSRKSSAWEEGLTTNKRWHFCQSIKTTVRNFPVGTQINFTRVIKYRKSRSWTSLNFYLYTKPFIHCLYFIYTRRNAH